MKFAKVTNIILWVILAISLFLTISLLTHISENKSDPGMDLWVNANLIWSYILIGIAIISAVVLEFINTVSDKKATKNALVAILFMGVVFLISYLLSSSAIPHFYGAQKFVENGTLTPGVSRWIGTGLIATYILAGLAVVVIVWSSVSRIFK